MTCSGCNSLKQRQNEDNAVDSFYNNIEECVNYLKICEVFQVASMWILCYSIHKLYGGGINNY